MGVLSDLYVSTPELAEAYDDEQTRPDNERAELSGLTEIEFSTLWAIIEGEEWEERHMDAFESILQKSDGERLIFRLPDAFVAKAATLSQGDAASAAEAWAETDELECDAEELLPAIQELTRLSKEAIRSGRSLYLWNCV
jgi:hypothetical protein